MVAFVGINDADPALGSTYPGTYDVDYRYSSQATFDYLAGRGIRHVRLAFRWERIQPTLGAALDATELGRLTSCVSRAATAGISIILNVQNFGAYTSGGVSRAIGQAGGPTQAQFVDLWTRLSVAFRDTAAVIGYGLMNEPHDLPTVYGSLSNAIVRYNWEIGGGYGSSYGFTYGE